VGLSTIVVASLYHYGEHSWRFRVESSDQIEVAGLQNVTRSQVMEAMGGDIGRNIFFIPLAQRQSRLEQIPWVESASVMRFVPNRLRIEIHERTPVAFARVGSRIVLTDKGGVLMDLPAAGRKKYSFPVIVGMNSGEPLSTRAARMQIFNDLVSQLDSGGSHYSQDLSEVDLSDPEDVKIVTNDRQGEVLVHLGASNYLDRYKLYIGHLREWRQQFTKLDSVDMRYENQIVVNPDRDRLPKQGSSSVARLAMGTGVTSAALVQHEVPTAKPVAMKMPKQTSRGVRNKHTQAHGANRRHTASPKAKPSVKTAQISSASLAKSKKPSAGIPKEHGQQ
jgi:cell division protein FtsQ